MNSYMSQEESFPGLEDRIRGRNALLRLRRSKPKFCVPIKESEEFKKGFLSMAGLYGCLDRIIDQSEIRT